MAMGSSRHWREVLRALTGHATIDPSGFLDYFKPLMDWLVKDNTEKNLNLGWEETTTCLNNSPSQYAGNNLYK